MFELIAGAKSYRVPNFWATNFPSQHFKVISDEVNSHRLSWWSAGVDRLQVILSFFHSALVLDNYQMDRPVLIDIQSFASLPLSPL